MNPEQKNYSSALLSHFINPQNVWHGKDETDFTLIQWLDRDTGNSIFFWIRLSGDMLKITECYFRASGAPDTIGVASWTTDFVKKKQIKEIILTIEKAAKGELALDPVSWHVTKRLKMMFTRMIEKAEY